jgi:hypothetical protein
MIKGATLDFAPSKELFHMTAVNDSIGTPFPVRSEELKALFYVRDFDGDPSYREKKEFACPPPPGSHRIRAEFADGEVIVGTTTAYRQGIAGFFLVPADAQSNNVSCFVFTEATREITLI